MSSWNSTDAGSQDFSYKGPAIKTESQYAGYERVEVDSHQPRKRVVNKKNLDQEWCSPDEADVNPGDGVDYFQAGHAHENKDQTDANTEKSSDDRNFKCDQRSLEQQGDGIE